MIIVNMLEKLPPHDEIAVKSGIIDSDAEIHTEEIGAGVDEANTALGAIQKVSIPLQRSKLDVDAAERRFSTED